MYKMLGIFILELDVAINLVFYYIMMARRAETHCNESQILTIEISVMSKLAGGTTQPGRMITLGWEI
jgi:hypothetical protein